MSMRSSSRRSRSRPRGSRRCSPATSISSRRCRRPTLPASRTPTCCTLITMPSTRVLTFELNQDRVPAFKDKRVRLAMSYALNRDGIAQKIMRGLATAAGELSPPGYAGYDPALAPRYDLAKAKALMQEAGYADGFSVTMMSPNNRYIEDAAHRRGGRRHAGQDQHQGRSADHAQGAILAALRRARRRHHDDRLAVRHRRTRRISTSSW